MDGQTDDKSSGLNQSTENDTENKEEEGVTSKDRIPSEGATDSSDAKVLVCLKPFPGVTYLAIEVESEIIDHLSDFWT